jgi:hypothetical protein
VFCHDALLVGQSALGHSGGVLVVLMILVLGCPLIGAAGRRRGFDGAAGGHAVEVEDGGVGR